MADGAAPACMRARAHVDTAYDADLIAALYAHRTKLHLRRQGDRAATTIDLLRKVVAMIEVSDIRMRTLCVLHQLSVRARAMAYDKESHERIAALLDTAELIAIKMAHSVDHADEMRDRLQTLVGEFPELDYILATFDGTVPNPPWRSW